MSKITREGTNPSYIAWGAIKARSAVKLDTTQGQLVQATANTDEVIGIVSHDQDVATGEAVGVHLVGVVQAVAWGTIAVWDKLTATTDGKVLTTTTAGHKVFATALEAWVDEDRIDILLRDSVLYSSI